MVCAEYCWNPSGAMSETSFSTEIRTVLDQDSGRIKVTAVVVSTTSRNTAMMTVLRMRMMRQ